MTDLLTREVEEQRQAKRSPGAPVSTKRLVVILSLIVGILAGWALFTNLGPSREELAQTHWEQVVDYYSEQYQVMTDTRARAEAAHWQDVINHYARQYELIANATSQPVPRDEAAYWQNVVDYYEQQWNLRSQ